MALDIFLSALDELIKQLPYTTKDPAKFHRRLVDLVTKWCPPHNRRTRTVCGRGPFGDDDDVPLDALDALRLMIDTLKSKLDQFPPEFRKELRRRIDILQLNWDAEQRLVTRWIAASRAYSWPGVYRPERVGPGLLKVFGADGCGIDVDKTAKRVMDELIQEIAYLRAISGSYVVPGPTEKPIGATDMLGRQSAPTLAGGGDANNTWAMMLDGVKAGRWEPPCRWFMSVLVALDALCTTHTSWRRMDAPQKGFEGWVLQYSDSDDGVGGEGRMEQQYTVRVRHDRIEITQCCCGERRSSASTVAIMNDAVEVLRSTLADVVVVFDDDTVPSILADERTSDGRVIRFVVGIGAPA